MNRRHWMARVHESDIQSLRLQGTIQVYRALIVESVGDTIGLNRADHPELSGCQ
jgi:hypothetical protein